MWVAMIVSVFSWTKASSEHTEHAQHRQRQGVAASPPVKATDWPMHTAWPTCTRHSMLNTKLNDCPSEMTNQYTDHWTELNWWTSTGFRHRQTGRPNHLFPILFLILLRVSAKSSWKATLSDDRQISFSGHAEWEHSWIMAEGYGHIAVNVATARQWWVNDRLIASNWTTFLPLDKSLY